MHALATVLFLPGAHAAGGAGRGIIMESATAQMCCAGLLIAPFVAAVCYTVSRTLPVAAVPRSGPEEQEVRRILLPDGRRDLLLAVVAS